MFDILPEECLFLIIGLIVGEKDNTNYPYYFGWNWKKKMTHKQISDGRLVKWRRPTFTRIIPLMMLSKRMSYIFDTNNMWTYLYEHEFRNGKPYKRKPIHARKRMRDKSNKVIYDRYKPILDHEKTRIEYSIDKIKLSMKQLHTIDQAFSNIRPQLGSEELTYDNETIDKLAVILSPMVLLPAGYINCWGNCIQYPVRMTLKAVTRERNVHRHNGMGCIDMKKKSKDKITMIEKIFEKI